MGFRAFVGPRLEKLAARSGSAQRELTQVDYHHFVAIGLAIAKLYASPCLGMWTPTPNLFSERGL